MPDFSSSGQRSPEWTRVTCAGELVTNALEWIDWEDLPVQVVLCEACGVTGCEVGGRVRLSRLGDHVLWTAPEIDTVAFELADREHRPSALIARHGALAIPAVVWESWAGVPALDTLPPTVRRDLRAAWEASAPPRSDAFASDAGSLEDALAWVDAAARWFEADAPAGELVPVGDSAVTIFYESPRFTEWTAVARVDDAVVPVFATLMPSHR